MSFTRAVHGVRRYIATAAAARWHGLEDFVHVWRDRGGNGKGGRRHLRTNKSFTAALFLRENGSVRATGERNEKPNRRKKKTLLFPPRTDYRRVLNTGPNIMFLSLARAPAHIRNRDKITHRTIGRDANDDSICILYESKVYIYKYNIMYKVSLTGNTHKAVFTSIPGRRKFCWLIVKEVGKLALYSITSILYVSKIVVL